MNQVIKYTGVGGRKVPPKYAIILFKFGQAAAELGYVLRSGAASGSDSFFEQGCDEVMGSKEIYLPKRLFEGSRSPLWLEAMEKRVEAESIASKIHPNWAGCNSFARSAHSRNAFQVLGPTLSDPSNFLVCWTEGGETIGGTATAIRLARKYGVPVYNIGKDKAREVIEGWIEDPGIVWLGRS